MGREAVATTCSHRYTPITKSKEDEITETGYSNGGSRKLSPADDINASAYMHH